MIKKHYVFDLSEFNAEYKRGGATCTAEEDPEEWLCDLTLDLDLDLPANIAKAIKHEARRQFETELQKEYGISIFHWKGDRRSSLLRLAKGDRVTFTGGAGEVVYVLPMQQKFGVKTTDGRVLNFTLKEFEHFLFQKI